MKRRLGVPSFIRATALLVCIGACGSSTPAPQAAPASSEPPPLPVTGEAGTSCAHEVVLECPEGQIDACLGHPDEGNFHKCVPAW